VGKYIIEVEVIKSAFTVRDWFSVLENNMMYCKAITLIIYLVGTAGSGTSTYTFLIGSTKGENEKSIRMIFDKTSKESNVTIKRIEVRGVEDNKVNLNSISCDQCAVVSLLKHQ